MSLRKNKRIVAIVVILVIAASLICYGTWGIVQRYRATHGGDITIPSTTVTYSTDKPSETPPSVSCDPSNLEDNQPSKIELPSANISGCIQKVGIDQNGAIAVPSNIHLAGWYIGSVLPGEQGVSIIDGHVQGRYSSAIFTDLHKISPGEKIKIQFGSGTTREFEVVDVDNYTIEQTAKEQYRQLKDIDKQLTLITCGGEYISKTQSYNERLVIRARLL